MIKIKKVEQSDHKSAFVDGVLVDTAEMPLKEGDLVFLLKPNMLVPNGVARMFLLHRTKAAKDRDGFYKMKSHAVLLVSKLFPQAPWSKDKTRQLNVKEGSTDDFSTLLGVITEENDIVSEEKNNLSEGLTE